MVNKEQAVIDFLINCPAIKNSPFYFNFINAQDDNKQLIIQGNDKATHTPYIDGSVLKQYTFTIIDFKSVAYNAIPKQLGLVDENVEEYLDVQGIIDWIVEQNDIQNYPDFGEHCHIDLMECTTDNPNLNSVDTSTTPSLAKYSVAIRITYLDSTKTIWNTK